MADLKLNVNDYLVNIKLSFKIEQADEACSFVNELQSLLQKANGDKCIVNIESEIMLDKPNLNH